MPSYKELFPDKWLHADVINGHRPRVTIEHVGIEQLFNPRTKKNETKLVVKFYKKDLRLICNKTQATALAVICKTEDFTRWPGHEVVLSTGKAPNGADTILISPVPDAPPPTTPADDATTLPESDASIWDSASPSTKSPDDASPAQLLRLTKLMAQAYGRDWGKYEAECARQASKGAVDRFSDLKAVEATVLERKLEAGLGQVQAQVTNGKVTAA